MQKINRKGKSYSAKLDYKTIGPYDPSSRQHKFRRALMRSTVRRDQPKSACCRHDAHYRLRKSTATCASLFLHLRNHLVATTAESMNLTKLPHDILGRIRVPQELPDIQKGTGPQAFAKSGTLRWHCLLKKKNSVMQEAPAELDYYGKTK